MSDPYHIDLYRKFDEMVAKTNLGNLDGFSSYDQDCILELYMMVIQECLALCLTQVGNGDYNRGRMDCHDNIKEVFGLK